MTVSMDAGLGQGVQEACPRIVQSSASPRTAVRTGTVHWMLLDRDLDAVCATWNELYALQLASTLANAIGAVDAVDAAATASGSGSTGPTDVSAADRTAIGDFGIAGAGFIVLAALLWEIGA